MLHNGGFMPVLLQNAYCLNRLKSAHTGRRYIAEPRSRKKPAMISTSDFKCFSQCFREHGHTYSYRKAIVGSIVRARRTGT